MDRHHILHNRQEWTLRPDAKKLRNTESLVPLITRETHVAIHRHCPPVPLLGFHALRRTLKYFEPDDDTLGTVDRLMQSIEIAVNDPRTHPIEKQLAQLAVWAIDLQRPFLRDELQS